MEEYYAIGVMSGTSLDGLDLAYCKFKLKKEQWEYKINATHFFPYNNIWQQKLKNAEKLSALELQLLNNEFGYLISNCVIDFIENNNIEKLDFISSHGHTIFHQPENKLTLQIGSGASIAANTGFTTICDFRTLDVALGGQGAPLVPIGDQYLFNEYHFCLNIGGFANISFEENSKRIAFDICPANIILNEYLINTKMPFDENGILARSGSCNKKLFDELNCLPFYTQAFPKSLGKEWVLENIYPLVDKYELKLEDCLATLVEHIAFQIAVITNRYSANLPIFITGGGAYHLFLLEKIQEYTTCQIIVPSKQLIEFKEAIIFAFLGVLRFTNRNNCLSSVTGAKQDNCGGTIYLGK